MPKTDFVLTFLVGFLIVFLFLSALSVTIPAAADSAPRANCACCSQIA